MPRAVGKVYHIKSHHTPLGRLFIKEDNMLDRFKKIVADYYNGHADATDHAAIKPEDVYVVWSCKTLQNWKALLSTPVPDGMYYELTYDGDRGMTYLDAYKKWENVPVPA